MDKGQWEEFLTQWSQEILVTDLAQAFPEQVTAAGWLGSPGATQDEIEQAEARLGADLPPSYRTFLEVTNGWPMVRPSLTRFWSSAEVEWLHIRRPELISAWRIGEAMGGESETIPDEKYFVYGEQQDSIWFRSVYLQDALEVSDLDLEMDAIYLLNPKVVTPQGEWEAWYFSSSLPGAGRYRSFAEMMRAEYRRCLEDLKYETEFSTEYLDQVRERLQPRVEQEVVVDVDALLAALEGAVERIRQDADPTTARSNSLPAYRQATVEAIMEVIEWVRPLQDQELANPELVSQLVELAAECDRHSETETVNFMQNMDMWEVLKAGLEFKLTGGRRGLERQFQGGGKPAGYMTAAMIIRVHLNPDYEG